MKTYTRTVVTYICVCYYDKVKICKVKALQIFSFPGGVFIGGHGQPAELLPTGKSFLGRKFAERGCCYERKTEAVL